MKLTISPPSKVMAFICVLIFTGTPRAFGQDAVGAIEGMVTDSSGASLAAHIAVKNIGSDLMPEVDSGGNGLFRLPQVMPGIYSVTVSSVHFGTSTNAVGDVVSEHQILDLPLNGRDFAQLGLLQSGVAPLTQSISKYGGSLRANQGYAVNGMRPESNRRAFLAWRRGATHFRRTGRLIAAPVS